MQRKPSRSEVKYSRLPLGDQAGPRAALVESVRAMHSLSGGGEPGRAGATITCCLTPLMLKASQRPSGEMREFTACLSFRTSREVLRDTVSKKLTLPAPARNRILIPSRDQS